MMTSLPKSPSCSAKTPGGFVTIEEYEKQRHVAEELHGAWVIATESRERWKTTVIELNADLTVTRKELKKIEKAFLSLESIVREDELRYLRDKRALEEENAALRKTLDKTERKDHRRTDTFDIQNVSCEKTPGKVPTAPCNSDDHGITVLAAPSKQAQMDQKSLLCPSDRSSNEAAFGAGCVRYFKSVPISLDYQTNDMSSSTVEILSAIRGDEVSVSKTSMTDDLQCTQDQAPITVYRGRISDPNVSRTDSIASASRSLSDAKDTLRPSRSDDDRYSETPMSEQPLVGLSICTTSCKDPVHEFLGRSDTDGLRDLPCLFADLNSVGKGRLPGSENVLGSDSEGYGTFTDDKRKNRDISRAHCGRSCANVSEYSYSGSESTWLSDASEYPPVLEDGHPFLLIKSEVVRRSLLAFQNWRQHPQNTNGTSPSVGTSNQDSSGRSVTSNKRSSAHSSADRKSQGDESDRENDHNGKRRKRTTKQALGNQLLLACPYLKKDPRKYRGCHGYVIKRIQDVKNHLSRYHQLPIYCPRCKIIFETEDDRDDHSMTVSCVPNDTVTYEGVTRAQKNLLTRRVSGRMVPQDQWFTIFDLLFPGHPRPHSAYINRDLSMDLVEFESFMSEDGPNIILSTLTSYNIQLSSIANEERDLAALQHTSLTEGLHNIFQQWFNNSMTCRTNDSDSGLGIPSSTASYVDGENHILERPSNPVRGSKSLYGSSSIMETSLRSAATTSNHNIDVSRDIDPFQRLESGLQQSLTLSLPSQPGVNAKETPTLQTADSDISVFPVLEEANHQDSGDALLGGLSDENEFWSTIGEPHNWAPFNP